jgi:hypothetical protein
MRQAACLLLLAAFSQNLFAAEPQCTKEARQQAEKLLAFHADTDIRIEIDQKVQELKPLPNPANNTQRFAVLEVWGYIYKGQYRMRFIYHRQQGSCLLIGQEVLEHARL